MTIKIEKKITSYEVAKDDPSSEINEENNVVRMHEKLERPETLRGNTYKI